MKKLILIFSLAVFAAQAQQTPQYFSKSGGTLTGPVSVASTLAAKNITSIGPRYDVTQFGAAGNGTTDDTAAIQAAFTACWNGNATPGKGGIVEFPGARTYLVSGTVHAYDSCAIEGTTTAASGQQGPPQIRFRAANASAGTAYATTGFTAAANSAPVYGPSSPAPYAQPYIITFTGANSFSVGQWAYISGCSSTAARGYNNTVAEVAAATSGSFSIVVPWTPPSLGSHTDTCSATVTNVALAFDANAHYQNSLTNISISSAGGDTAAQKIGVGVYFGSRIDTGTRIYNTWSGSATYYGYYASAGGINVDFDKGWRCDSDLIGCIYWRVTGFDSFGIANGTTDNGTGTLTAASGASVVFDDTGCGANSVVHFTSRNMKIEVNSTIQPGWGVFTMLGCPSNPGGIAFDLDLENTWMAPAGQSTSGINFTSFAMLPANDMALSLSIMNGGFQGGISPNTTARFAGLPILQRNDIYNLSQTIPFLSYGPPVLSSHGYRGYRAPISLIGDVNIGQLWQDGIPASAFLYSDTAYAALPNATTLYAGQILAPPSYWSGANGKRYAVDVVYQTGTTGTPNSGATTCTGTSGTALLTCTSATDLSVGQRISIGTDINKGISYVDATNSSAVVVHLTGNLASTYSTAAALSFSAPVLGPEIQLPTKSSAAPTTLAWSQGDVEQNSGAAANGIAAWVNVAGGTPGTWAGIPLGNSSGQIATSQIAPASLQGTDTKVMTAGTVSGTGSPLCTDANGGATTSGCHTGSGSGTVTIVPLNSAGIGATASCFTSQGARCTPFSGFITLTSGTASLAAGRLVSVTFAAMQHAQVCAVSPAGTPANAVALGISVTNNSVAEFDIQANVAPAASTTYKFQYVCSN